MQLDDGGYMVGISIVLFILGIIAMFFNWPVTVIICFGLSFFIFIPNLYLLLRKWFGLY